MYANLYLCGTKMLDGVFEDEFALLPFKADMTGTEIHKQSMLYNYPPVVTPLAKGDGDITAFTLADFTDPDNSVVLTALYPENGHLLARFCNFADCPATVDYIPTVGKVTAETDLLGNEKSPTDGKHLAFRPWEIKTIKIEI